MKCYSLLLLLLMLLLLLLLFFLLLLLLQIRRIRINRQEMFYKRNFAQSIVKHLCRSLFWSLQVGSLQLYEKQAPALVLSCECAKHLTTIILQNTLEQLFLKNGEEIKEILQFCRSNTILTIVQYIQSVIRKNICCNAKPLRTHCNHGHLFVKNPRNELTQETSRKF